MKSFKEFILEEPVNCAGSGAVAGFDPVLTRIIRRRKDKGNAKNN